MSKEIEKRLARRGKKQPQRSRRLAVEALETRNLLSATDPAAMFCIGPLPADSLLVDHVSMVGTQNSGGVFDGFVPPLAPQSTPFACWLVIDISFLPVASSTAEGESPDAGSDPRSREAGRSDLTLYVINVVRPPQPVASPRESGLARSFDQTKSALPAWSAAPPLLNPAPGSLSVFPARQPVSEVGFFTRPAVADAHALRGGEHFSLARPLTSTSDEGFGAGDSSGRYDDHVVGGQGTPVCSRSTTDGNHSTAARDIWWDDALVPLADAFGRTRLSLLEEATEGGLVDIDELLDDSGVSSGRPAASKGSSTEIRVWDPGLRNLVPSGSLDSACRRRSGERAAPTPGERVLERVDERDGWHDTAQRAGRARIAAEGGMIALVAAEDPRAAWTQADVLTPPAAAGTREVVLPPGTGGIRMDAGVGLFQAFELGTRSIEIGAGGDFGTRDRCGDRSGGLQLDGRQIEQ